MLGGRSAQLTGTDLVVGRAYFVSDRRALENTLARSRPNGRTIVTISLRQWGVFASAARQVPFAEVGGRVAGLLEQSRQQRRLRVEPVGHPSRDIRLMFREVLMHSVACREVPRDDRGSAGRTDRVADVELLKVGPLLGKPIQVGCLDMRMTVTCQIVPNVNPRFGILLGEKSEAVKPQCTGSRTKATRADCASPRILNARDRRALTLRERYTWPRVRQETSD